MPQMVPIAIPRASAPQNPAYYPAEFSNEVEFKINWAKIFNIVVLIGVSLFLWAYGY
eukprot:CAMPEP_0168339406 /NCGR_PEP_ID=MMETSP0213-20121227/13437_1 /TAXON_ID=151035 /ORGANISM="Euplotes harpa, Strain FSP1.4" /LENGTH=56 /DNA_ID=CAMNT_0008345421 /DNA_START=54 /DNA_END=221 /DNA_ORIENTATION=+